VVSLPFYSSLPRCKIVIYYLSICCCFHVDNKFFFFFFDILATRLQNRDATTFSKLGVQFLGLGICTEQNTDGIPSFVDCSLLRNGNHTLHQKVRVVHPIFFFWGGGPEPPSGPQWLRPCFRTGLKTHLFWLSFMLVTRISRSVMTYDRRRLVSGICSGSYLIFF